MKNIFSATFFAFLGIVTIALGLVVLVAVFARHVILMIKIAFGG